MKGTETTLNCTYLKKKTDTTASPVNHLAILVQTTLCLTSANRARSSKVSSNHNQQARCLQNHHLTYQSSQALQARRGGKGKSNSNMEASEADAGASRTPEDSVCSVEGPSHYTEGDMQA